MSAELQAESVDQVVGDSWRYTNKLTEIDQESRELLIGYAKLPDDDQVLLAHIHHLRAKAWEKDPYGCVGLFTFTRPMIQKAPNYATIRERLITNDAKFLDLGCGFGQNVRKLVIDGVPAQNVAGADISQSLVDCGYEYFQDRDTLSSQFLIGNILDQKSSIFTDAAGSFDIIFAALLYHLWDWDEQVSACIATTKLLKPQAGSTIFGWQLGSSPAGRVVRPCPIPGRPDKILYHHDEGSWLRLWAEVEAGTGTRWDVQVRAQVSEEDQQRKNAFPVNPGQKVHVLGFSMTRL